MPQVFADLDLSHITQELTRRGYGFDSCRGFAFRLSVRSKTDIVKSTGLGRWTPIGGPTPLQIAEIRRTSRSVKHAADRVEAIALGRDQEVADSQEGGSGIDMATIGKLIDNKIDSKMRSVQSSLDTIMAALGAKAPPPEVPPSLPALPDPDPVDPEPVMRAPLVQTPAPPVPGKRPRGRPRKHPLPVEAE